MRSRLIFVFLLLMLFTTLLSAEAETAVRNAVFNGDFIHGLTGWKTEGGSTGNTEINVEQLSQEDDVESILVLRRKTREGTFHLFNNYPIKVEQNRIYRLEVQARGEGNFTIGVYEYAPKFLRTKTSKPFQLTGQVAKCVFEYTPSPDCLEVRPVIALPAGTDGDPLTTIRIHEYTLPLEASLFDKAVSWPKKTAYRASEAEILQGFREKFKDFHPFTPQQESEITAAVKKMDTILPPYKPIRRVESRVFDLTTSRIAFADSGLPGSVTVLGRELLSRPVAIEIESEGKMRHGPLQIKAGEQSVLITQKGRQGGIAVSISAELMYDALLNYTVTLHADKPTHIGRVSLIFSYTEETGRYIRYNAFRRKPDRVYGFGQIPRPGEKVESRYSLLAGQWPNNWNPAVSVEPEAVIWTWNDGYLPHFWIGDEERGLGWIAPGDQGWLYKKGDITFRLERQGKAIVARVVVMAQPQNLEGTAQFQFSVQATPPKPLPEDWFRQRIALSNISRVTKAYSSLSDEQRRAPLASFTETGKLDTLWWTLWSVGEGSPRAGDPQALKDMVKASRYNGIEALPYLAPTHLTINSPEGFHYGVETRQWAQVPYKHSLGEPRKSIVKLCPNSFFSEYQAQAIGKMIDDYDISGIYFDNCGLTPCSNELHGCGYLRDGERRETIPYMAMRNFFMMVRHQFVQRGKRPLIMTHGGDMIGPISFVDYVVTGEGVYGLDHTEAMTMGEIRASMIGPNQFGTLTFFLPQFSYGYEPREAYREEVTRRLLAMTLLHGTKVWGIFCNKIPVQSSWKAFDRLTENTVDFLPYWKWAVNRSLNEKGIYAVLYRQKGQAILAVSNLSGSEQEVSLPMAELLKVFSGLKTVEDVTDNLPVRLSDDRLTLDVKAKDYRLILLRR